MHASSSLEAALRERREGRYAEALALLRRSADEEGDSQGQWELGQAHWWGSLTLRRDFTEAARLFRASALGGNAMGMADYASVLCFGEGVEPDQEASDAWAAKALASCHPYAVGLCFYAGLGVEPDLARAREEYEVAARQGVAAAQSAAGLLYADDDLMDEAMVWVAKAAEQGLAASQHSLAFMAFHKGDMDVAYHWCRKSAEQGYDLGLHGLADILFDSDAHRNWGQGAQVRRLCCCRAACHSTGLAGSSWWLRCAPAAIATLMTACPRCSFGWR